MPKTNKTTVTTRGPNFHWDQEKASQACLAKKQGKTNEQIAQELGAKVQSVTVLFARLRKAGVPIPKAARGPAVKFDTKALTSLMKE